MNIYLIVAGFLAIAFVWAFILLNILRSGFKIKKKFLIVVLLVFISLGVIVILIGVTIEYMDSPEFCGTTCHPRANLVVHDSPMEPFYESYKEPGNNSIMSIHEENEVTCSGCHDNPGLTGKIEAYVGAIPEMFNYVTGNYDTDNLGGDYPNENCLKCHDDHFAVEPGEVITFLNTSVNPHDDEDNDCADCHAPHQKGTGETRDACIVCHGTKIDNFAEKLDAHGTTTNSTTDEDCMVCHNREHNREYPEFGKARIPFSEVPKYINNDFCSDCHEIQNDAYSSWTSVERTLYGDCISTCHTEHNIKGAPHIVITPFAENCDQCHTNGAGSHTLFDISFNNFTFDINNKFCEDCHKTQYDAVLKWDDSQKSFYGDCTSSCHTEHRESIAPHLSVTPFKDNCNTCHLDGIDSHSLNNIMYSNFKFDIENDFCSDCHSNEYNSLQLRNHSKRDCLDCHAEHGKVQVLDFSDCTTCHSDGQVISGKELHDIPSSHDVNRTGCSDCHNIYVIHDV